MLLRFITILTLNLFYFTFSYGSTVTSGIEVLFEPGQIEQLRGKKIGLITNHTAVTSGYETTISLMKRKREEGGYSLVALFGPEHGITGQSHASEHIADERDEEGIPIYSLHGDTRRPTPEMLNGINLLIYDIQDIGSRSYTYISTLFYCMEEAAKKKIPVIVCDRPNPINGVCIDGPMLDPKFRSFVGYVDVPYCHGMTVGELARLFNEEYKIKCDLKIIPMRGWQRGMSFRETGLPWIPTSPNIPTPESATLYPVTGILGELGAVSIGIGTTLPFQVIGAPWINGEIFARHLNAQKYPGVKFLPFAFKPFFGKFSQTGCGGVMIVVEDHKKFLPVSTQYLLIGILKSLYPEKFELAMSETAKRASMFNKVNGTDRIYEIMKRDKAITWKLREVDDDRRKEFRERRKRFLIGAYS
jgi:uncharacterized protein YbbC (DUF1343 family)